MLKELLQYQSEWRTFYRGELGKPLQYLWTKKTITLEHNDLCHNVSSGDLGRGCKK